MDPQLLEFVFSKNEIERSDAIKSFLATIKNPENIVVILEFLNISKLTKNWDFFSRAIFILNNFIKIMPGLSEMHFKFIYEQIFSFVSEVPGKYGTYVIDCLETIIQSYQIGFSTHLFKNIKLFNEKNDETLSTILLLLGKHLIPFLLSSLLDEDEVTNVLNKFTPKVLSILEKEHTKEFAFAASELVSSVFENLDYIPPNIEEIGNILISDKNVMHSLMMNGKILSWISLSIAPKVLEIAKNDEQTYRTYAIDTLAALIADQATYDDVMPFIGETVINVDLKESEKEFNDELNFAMNVMPDDDSPSFRGAVIRLVKTFAELEDKKESKKTVDGVIQLFGLKLSFNNEESLSFCFLLQSMFTNSLSKDEIDFLIEEVHKNKDTTALMALFSFNKEMAITEAKKVSDPTPLLSIALESIIPKEVNKNDIYTLIDHWETLAKETSDDTLVDEDEIQCDLLRVIEIIEEGPSLSEEQAEKLLSKVYYCISEYRYTYCDDVLSNLVIKIIKKCKKVPQKASDLIGIILELSDGFVVKEELIDALCYVVANKDVDISDFEVEIFSIGENIISSQMAMSSSIYVLLAILIQRVTDYSELLEEISFNAFRSSDEEVFFAGGVILLTTILINNEQTRVPHDVIENWIENSDMCEDERVLKYSWKGLSILSKNYKVEGIKTAAETALITEPGENEIPDVELPYDHILEQN